jgi:hypothetical protein
MEAVLEDTRLGFTDNARAGMSMAVNPPGDTKANPKTGAGPSRFTPDHKAILYFPPLPRQWVDLYSTWNLAFVSHYPDHPFFFAKLLTPQVGCYQAAPEGYLYNRGMALYTHIYFTLFTRLDRKAKKPALADMDWSNKDLTKLWAKVNAASAHAYDEALAKADPSLANEIKLRVSNALQWLQEHSVGKTLEELRSFISNDVLAKLNPKNWSVTATVEKGLKNAGQKVKDAFEGLKKHLKFR